MGEEEDKNHADFNDTGAVAEVTRAKEVFDDALFCRTQKGGLYGKDGKPEDSSIHVVLVKTEEHASHDEELKDAHDLDDARLAKAVRQPTCEGGKKDVREDVDSPETVFEHAAGCSPKPNPERN